jgi:dTDP-4-dehydrorhamnose 3,5-epimerase
MIFSALNIEGAFRIDLEKQEDQRGFFARLFCAEEFAAEGLEGRWVQMNTSLSYQAGTLRGLHFQRPPMTEVKVVRCLRGAAFDVIVDLRTGSPTYGHWVSIDLTAENRSMVYVPAGFAHGFQALMPNTELLYLHSTPYSSTYEGGLHYDDPELAITWPLPVTEMSPRDAKHPPLKALAPASL